MKAGVDQQMVPGLGAILGGINGEMLPGLSKMKGWR